MDDAVRDLHRELHPPRHRDPIQIRVGTVQAFHAGPPRTADIFEGATTNPIPAVPLLECCANLTAGNRIVILRQGDLRWILSREA